MLFQPPAPAHAPIHTQPTTPLKANVPEMERHEDGGSIRPSFPSQGHPPVPSVRAIRLGDIPLGLPSPGHPSNQVNQKKNKKRKEKSVMFSRPIQLTSKGLLFKRIDLQNDFKTSINS